VRYATYIPAGEVRPGNLVFKRLSPRKGSARYVLKRYTDRYNYAIVGLDSPEEVGDFSSIEHLGIGLQFRLPVVAVGETKTFKSFLPNHFYSFGLRERKYG